MSRSLHTTPYGLRAQRRVLHPDESRAAGARRSRQTLAADAIHPEHAFPRITICPAVPGIIQPLTAAAVRDLLERVGPEYWYGLREVRIAANGAGSPGSTALAEYRLPGTIIVYGVTSACWRIGGLVSMEALAHMTECGARILHNPSPWATHICWTQDSLAAFYLRHVLPHELGHHRIQHRSGKPRRQRCRRADHEALARLYALRLNQSDAQQEISLP